MSRKVCLAPDDDRGDAHFDEEDGVDEVVDDVGKGESGKKNEESGDSWRIDTVPNEFESISLPSQVVQNLLQKKEKLHKTTLKEMQQELITIQEKCSDKFETLGDQLKSKIDEIREEIHDMQRNFENHIHRFNAAERQKMNDKLTSLLAVEESLINEFHKEICENEMRRTASVRKTLRKFRKKLINIAHVPPGALEIPTDEEIKEYNEKIRHNYAIFDDLRLNLRLRTSNLNSELHDWLDEIKIFR